MYRIPHLIPNYHGLRRLWPSAVSGSTLLVYTEIIRSLGVLPIRPPVIGARFNLSNRLQCRCIIKLIFSQCLKLFDVTKNSVVLKIKNTFSSKLYLRFCRIFILIPLRLLLNVTKEISFYIKIASVWLHAVFNNNKCWKIIVLLVKIWNHSSFHKILTAKKLAL